MRSFLPIEEVQISHLTGHFRRSAPGGLYALYAKRLRLTDMGCVCHATGSCRVCQAWADTAARLNHARMGAK